MRIEKTEVYGFKAAIRGMRNPKDSWGKSDSSQILTSFPDLSMKCAKIKDKNHNVECVNLGAADQKLSQQLTKAGSEHCKHLRMIQVWVDMTLPRYIWQEMDTYRHVEKVSCSTMHKLMSYDLTPDMFEGGFGSVHEEALLLEDIKECIEIYHMKDTTPENKQKLKLGVKRKLPESFLQKRTLNTNYQQLLNIYNQRKNHELPEWKHICEWIKELPYFVELTGLEV